MVEQLTQVIVPTALTLAGDIRTAGDFDPPFATELKLFTYLGSWMLLAGRVSAALVLAPALRQHMDWDGPGRSAQDNPDIGSIQLIDYRHSPLSSLGPVFALSRCLFLRSRFARLTENATSASKAIFAVVHTQSGVSKGR